MFQLINTIRFANTAHYQTWFKVIYDKAYWVEENTLYSFSSNLVKEQIKKYDQPVQLNKGKTALLIGNDSIGYDILKIDGTFIATGVLKGFDIPFDTASDDHYFFQRDRSAKIYRSGIFRAPGNKEVFRKEKILNIIFADEIYLTADLEALDDQGEVRWSIDHTTIHNGGADFKVLGQWRNNLLLSFGENTIVLVDLASGTVKKTFRETPSFTLGSETQTEISSASSFVLDREAGQLVGAFHTYLFVIDLVSGKITCDDLKDALSKSGVRSFRPVTSPNPFNATHVFLTARAESADVPHTDLSALVAINRNTKNVDWIHTLPLSDTGVNAPYIADRLLFQVDTENTLHIFVRTEKK